MESILKLCATVISMLTLEQIRLKLQDRNLKKVANNIGMNYLVLWRAVKKNTSPSYKTVKKISDYLERNE